MDRDVLSPGAQPTPCSSALCSLHSEILGSVPSHSPQGSGLSTLSLNAWLHLPRLSPRSRHSWVILIPQFLAWALPSRAGPLLHGPRSRSTVFHFPSPFMVSYSTADYYYATCLPFYSPYTPARPKDSLSLPPLHLAMSEVGEKSETDVSKTSFAYGKEKSTPNKMRKLYTGDENMTKAIIPSAL